MKTTVYFLIGAILLLQSCSNTKDKEIVNYPVLKVSLSDTETSFFDLFTKAELIPLETTSNSLIKYISKVIQVNDKYYVFDERQSALFIFNNAGKYVDKIHRVGHGPGEYKDIYDCCIDETRKIIYMLSPYGSVYAYDLNSLEFLERYKLPFLPNYQEMDIITGDSLIFFSLVQNGTSAFNVISLASKKIINHYYDDSHPEIWGGRLFRDDKQNRYFYLYYHNEIYEYSGDGCKIAYKWDFGQDAIDLSAVEFGKTEEELAKTIRKFYELYESNSFSKIKFIYSLNQQNKLYYYAQIQYASKRFSPSIIKNIFYDKNTGKSFVFKTTTEGISLDLIYSFNNEYIMSSIEPKDKDILANILSDKDKPLLDSILEDDNPYLVKYYFKK
jgi:hypothetical protein